MREKFDVFLHHKASTVDFFNRLGYSATRYLKLQVIFRDILDQADILVLISNKENRFIAIIGCYTLSADVRKRLSEKREQIMVTTREPAVWSIHGGRTGDANSLFLNHSVIALGWDNIGDLSVLSPDREAFKVRVAEVYDYKPGAIPVVAGEMYRFVYEMQIGDLVVYFSKYDRQIHIGRVDGAYTYKKEPEPRYPHHRTVRWMKTLPLTHFSQQAFHEIGSAMTFFQVKNYGEEFRAALEGRILPPPISTDETVALVSEDILRDTSSDMRSNNVIEVPTSSEEEITFEGHEGIEGLAVPLALGKRTIHTKSDDPQIDAFYGKYKRGKLILQPDFQRLFVWDRAKARSLSSILWCAL